ncbi:MAG TPA: hypothetical protein VNQ77_03740 [Frankiaceae bacterium]|nr:hypothetical protein [Frankiaceae bacterium]
MAKKRSAGADAVEAMAPASETVHQALHGGMVKTSKVRGELISRSGRTVLTRVKVSPDAPSVYEVGPKLTNLIHALGNNTVAELLGVSRSQPGRWARGEEGISAENQAAILDLDFVMSLLLRTMSAELAGIWLVSPNAHLSGARPVDAFRIGGHRRVVEAIQAYAEGAFA